MKNHPVWFVRIHPGSPRVSRAGDGVPPRRTFPASCLGPRSIISGKRVSARCRKRRPRRARCRLRLVALVIFAPLVCLSQEPTPTPSPVEAEAEQVVVTATRFDIPLDLSPASVSVINSEDFEQKQIERVSDALREVPGLSV